MTACKHENSIPTRREQSNGVTVVFLQCQVCGSGRALKKEGVDLASLPPYDPEIKERHWNKWLEECNQRAAEFNAEIAGKRDEWFAAYNLYLESDHWKTVRRMVLIRDYWCQKCFKVRSQQAHHLSYTTYNRYGFSFPHECVGICIECHESITTEGRHV